MKAVWTVLNIVVTVFLLLAANDAAAQSATTDAEQLDRLFADLKDADPGRAQVIESDITRIWSRSGSATMDLLLERGRKALDQGDTETAIEHLTALTDHAPEFAEGWNMRAAAFYQAGRFGMAVADIRRALALNPRQFDALAGFGMILEQLDRKPQALEVYRAVLAIHPQMQEVLEAVERLEVEIAGQNI